MPKTRLGADTTSTDGAEVTTEHPARETRNDGLERRVSVKVVSAPQPSSCKLIFLGNGPLADSTLAILEQHCDIIFHANDKSDLDQVVALKRQFPNAHAVLASFGVLIKPEILELFEPEGILNLHPSKLPAYRGPSPIESAILAGDNTFSYSIMKLARTMDAGPIYHQATLENLPLEKSTIYHELATAGAQWLVEKFHELKKSGLSSLSELISPTPQDDSIATFTKKLTKSDAFLEPEKFPAETILRQIIAYQGFPKPKYSFFKKTCIILKAHFLSVDKIIHDVDSACTESTPLMLRCADRNFVVVEKLQPEGKKPMDARSFINGYAQH